MHTFAVNICTPAGRYAAYSAADARAGAVEMAGGGDVSWVKQLD